MASRLREHQGVTLAVLELPGAQEEAHLDSRLVSVTYLFACHATRDVVNDLDDALCLPERFYEVAGKIGVAQADVHLPK